MQCLCSYSEWPELASFPALVIKLSRLMPNESHVAPSSDAMWVVIVLAQPQQLLPYRAVGFG